MMEQSVVDYRLSYIMDFRLRHKDVMELCEMYGCDKENIRGKNDKLYGDFIESQIRLHSVYLKRSKTFEAWKERKKTIQFIDDDYDEFSKAYQEFPKEEIFIADENSLTVWNLKVDSSFIMFAALNFTSFSTIQVRKNVFSFSFYKRFWFQKIDLFRTSLLEDALLVLLEVI